MSKQDQRVYQKLIKSNAKIIKFANVNIFAWIIKWCILQTEPNCVP